MIVGIFVGERAFGTGLSRNGERRRRELAVPCVFGFDDAIFVDGFEAFTGIGELDDGDGFGEAGGFGISVKRLVAFCESPGKENAETQSAVQESPAAQEKGGLCRFSGEVGVTGH